jgi:hypothetical protein
MSGGLSAIENTGLREVERAGACGSDPATPLCSFLQEGHERWRRHSRLVVADHEQSVEPAPIECLSIDRNPGRTSHQTTGLREQDYLIERVRSGEVRSFQHGDDAQIHRLKPGVQDHPDAQHVAISDVLKRRLYDIEDIPPTT